MIGLFGHLVIVTLNLYSKKSKKRSQRIISLKHSELNTHKKLYDFTFTIKTEDKEYLVRFNRTDNLYFRAEKFMTKHNLGNSFGDTRTQQQIIEHMERILENDRKTNPKYACQNGSPETQTPAFNPHSQIENYMSITPSKEDIQKRKEHHSKWVQEKDDEDARKKEVLDRKSVV